jgi:hypothetical protein
MSTTEIANAIAYLKRSTLRDALEQVGVPLSAREAMIMNKLNLVKLFENAALAVGIDLFVSMCNGATLLRMGALLEVVCDRRCIVESILRITLLKFLKMVESSILYFSSLTLFVLSTIYLTTTKAYWWNTVIC